MQAIIDTLKAGILYFSNTQFQFTFYTNLKIGYWIWRYESMFCEFEFVVDFSNYVDLKFLNYFYPVWK